MSAGIPPHTRCGRLETRADITRAVLLYVPLLSGTEDSMTRSQQHTK